MAAFQLLLIRTWHDQLQWRLSLLGHEDCPLDQLDLGLLRASDARTAQDYAESNFLLAIRRAQEVSRFFTGTEIQVGNLMFGTWRESIAPGAWSCPVSDRILDLS